MNNLETIMKGKNISDTKLGVELYLSYILPSMIFIIFKDDIFAVTNRDGTVNVGVSFTDLECMAISNGTMNCS